MTNSDSFQRSTYDHHRSGLVTEGIAVAARQKHQRPLLKKAAYNLHLNYRLLLLQWLNIIEATDA